MISNSESRINNGFRDLLLGGGTQSKLVPGVITEVGVKVEPSISGLFTVDVAHSAPITSSPVSVTV